MISSGRRIAVAVLCTAMLSAPAALAAPTCLDRNGDTIRCGAAGAMPVGWTPSPRLLLEKEMRPTNTHWRELLEVFCGLGVFLALVALLPEFDGTRDRDWNEQEGDDEER
jgi:hypothetical protein